MVYILNTKLKNEKKIEFALSQIFGISLNLAKQICGQLGFSCDTRISKLSNSQIDELSQIISQYYFIGPELKKNIKLNIQRLIRIGCYRGFRHTESLPVRGQRTHGNARTSRNLKLKNKKKLQ
jgi:small subunit ribosomal protein S13